MNKFILLLLSFGVVFLSCSKFENLDETAINNPDAEFAIPIGKANFSIGDLVEDFGDGTAVLVDPDGTIRLNYKNNIPINTTADDIFAAIQATLTGAGTGLDFFPVLDTFINLPFGSPNGVDIDFMILKKGKLIYNVFNNKTESLDVELEIPEAVKDGVPLERSFTLLPAANLSDTIDLTDYRLLPNNDSISLRYNAVTATGEPHVFPLFAFTMKIDQIEFSYAEGYFGQVLHEGAPDSIVIDFFDDWVQGNVYFKDPTITFYSNNSFGIPTQAVIYYFDVETLNLGRVPLESPYINDPDSLPRFAYPTLPDEVGLTKQDTFVFNSQNSNIDEVLGAGPKIIYFDVDALTNPDSNRAVRGFITDESAYSFDVEADLPLLGTANGFEVSDTISWDFSNYDEVSHAEFKIVADNGIGLEIVTQGYFLNENGVVLDSLFKDGSKTLIEAAEVDNDGNSLGIANTVNFELFDADRFAKIKSAKNLLINASFFSGERGEKCVRIKEDQNVEIRLGMKFGLN